MSEKYIVVQGAVCRCQFGSSTDRLRVNSHQKEYANDAEGKEKKIASSCETGTATFENNSFGSCSRLGSPPPPCRVSVQEWLDFYDQTTLSNGGKILVEDSRAICTVAGTACISVIQHGQIEEPSARNFENVHPHIQKQINPLVDIRELLEEEETAAWALPLTEPAQLT